MRTALLAEERLHRTCSISFFFFFFLPAACLPACLQRRAMDSDSFLEFLSPGFNDFDLVWGPGDGGPCSTQAPALQGACLPDAFINAEGLVPENAEEEEAEQVLAMATSQMPVSPCNGALLSDVSETYSSVLKLSDIASALHNFSRASFPSSRCRSPIEKPPPAQIDSSAPLVASPSRQESMALHPPLQSITPNPVELSRMQQHASISVFPGSDAQPAATDSNVAGKMVLSQSAIEAGSFHMQSFDSATENEKESSSKLTSDGGSAWDCSDNEMDEDDGGFDDSNPCVSHVRIIRRPNSKCGQASAPSPKRLKLDLVKAEVTSSSETANMQDDKDGASSLRQMRKEGMSQREVHILSERQRRKSMRESFSILQSLVPKLKIKHADRITVLTEVITYIQSLRGTLEDLERKKADMMDLLGLTSKMTLDRPQADLQCTVTYVKDNGNSDEKMGKRLAGWCSLQNGERVATVEVTVRMCGADVFVTLSTPQCRGVWSGVLSLLQKYSIEVSNATLAMSGDSSFHCIHAKAKNLPRVEGVDLQEKLEGIIIKELRRPARRGQI